MMPYFVAAQASVRLRALRLRFDIRFDIDSVLLIDIFTMRINYLGGMITDRSIAAALAAVATIGFFASLLVILIKCACCRRKAKAKVLPGKVFIGSSTVPPVVDEEANENKAEEPKTAAADAKLPGQEPKLPSPKPIAPELCKTRQLEKERSTKSVSKEVVPYGKSQNTQRKSMEDSVIHGRNPPYKYIKPPEPVFVLEEIEHTPPLEKVPTVRMKSLAPPAGESSRIEVQQQESSFARYLHTAFDKKSAQTAKSASVDQQLSRDSGARSLKTCPILSASAATASRKKAGRRVTIPSPPQKSQSIKSKSVTYRSSATVSTSRKSKK